MAKRTSPPNPLPDVLKPSDVRALVFNTNAEPQAWFAKTFAGEIKRAIATLTVTFNEYRALGARVFEGEREATVMLFIHAAVNSLITSLHLFVSGLPIPAGQLMRHFAESIAMAMLCADTSLNVYEKYALNRRDFAVHKSLDMILRKDVAKSLAQSLRLDNEGYQKFAKVMRFYDNHSHASALTLAFSMMFSADGGLIVGSQVDPTKRDQYRNELKRYSLGARLVRDLIASLDSVLPKRPV